MKIDIGESLALTYLKHIQKCRVVQTNWKTSGIWEISPEHKKNCEKLFKTLKKSPNFSRVFGQNDFDQLLKQAEIDVLGIDVIDNAVWGVEVAIHSEGSGLNYGSKEETIGKVAKKLFRMILIMQCYFNGFGKYNALFITPKMQADMKSKINSLIKEIKEVVNDEAINIQLISDEDFFNHIVEPVIAQDFKHHDTSELFSRFATLLKLNYSFLANERKVKEDIVDTPKISHQQTSKVPRTEEGMKIGQFVQVKMRELEEKNLLSETEISNLLSADYSKEVFNQDFAVLKELLEGRKDDKGRDRYYANIFFERYYLTSQWYERHWELLLKWLSQFKNK